MFQNLISTSEKILFTYETNQEEIKATLNNRKAAKNKEAFIRWQQKQIEESSKLNNLLIAASFATIGFVITQLVRDDFKFRDIWSQGLIVYGAIGNIITISFLIWHIFNRLKGFRITTQIARNKQLNKIDILEMLRAKNRKVDKRTKVLFSTSIVLFAASEMCIIIGFAVQVWGKIQYS